MSKLAEYEVDCSNCGWSFRGVGRGPAHGEQEAIDAAVASWRQHNCPGYLLRAPHAQFTGAQFQGLTDKIAQMLPGVIFTVNKV